MQSSDRLDFHWMSGTVWTRDSQWLPVQVAVSHDPLRFTSSGRYGVDGKTACGRWLLDEGQLHPAVLGGQGPWSVKSLRCSMCPQRSSLRERRKYSWYYFLSPSVVDECFQWTSEIRNSSTSRPISKTPIIFSRVVLYHVCLLQSCCIIFMLNII